MGRRLRNFGVMRSSILRREPTKSGSISKITSDHQPYFRRGSRTVSPITIPRGILAELCRSVNESQNCGCADIRNVLIV